MEWRLNENFFKKTWRSKWDNAKEREKPSH